MYEDFNSWLIGLLSSIPTMPNGIFSLILLWFCLFTCVYVASVTPTEELGNDDEMDGTTGFILILFILHLIFNIRYCFFILPPHFLVLSKCLIFIFPYIVVSFFGYYLNARGVTNGSSK